MDHSDVWHDKHYFDLVILITLHNWRLETSNSWIFQLRPELNIAATCKFKQAQARASSALMFSSYPVLCVNSEMQNIRTIDRFQRITNIFRDTSHSSRWCWRCYKTIHATFINMRNCGSFSHILWTMLHRNCAKHWHFTFYGLWINDRKSIKIWFSDSFEKWEWHLSI